MAQLTTDNTAWRTPAARDGVPPKRYRIGELARYTGLTRQTLHNYTRWGLITEAEWTPGGHRLYDESVFARLAVVLRLRQRHTVDEMLKLLGDPEATPEAALATPERDSADQVKAGAPADQEAAA